MASSDGVEHLLGNLDMSVRRKLHEPGTDDGWHGIIEEGGEFAPEADRYHLYIGKSAARTTGAASSAEGLQDSSARLRIE